MRGEIWKRNGRIVDGITDDSYGVGGREKEGKGRKGKEREGKEGKGKVG